MVSQVHGFVRAALCGALLISPLAATAQTATFDPQQRSQIEQIVKDYLLKHPEVIQEAAAELERRQQEEQKTAQKSALESVQDALYKSSHDVVAGNPQGDVTLVEFFDYNCGYCKRALADVRSMIKADPKLKVILKDFPVLGPESVEASRIAIAAEQQIKGDKLFDFHTRLLESRGRVNGERALAVAKEMGLDLARLQKDAAGNDVRNALQENMATADKLGLTGTPSFILADEVIPGAVGAEPLSKAIAAVRQCGHVNC